MGLHVFVTRDKDYINDLSDYGSNDNNSSSFSVV